MQESISSKLAVTLKGLGMWQKLSISEGLIFRGHGDSTSLLLREKRLHIFPFTSKIFSTNDTWVADLTNNEGRKFFIDFTLQFNFFTICTRKLQMGNNVVLLLLQLWSWNALFMIRVLCN